MINEKVKLAEVKEPTLAEQLAEIDGFPVDWAGRNKDGNFELRSSAFRVAIVPTPMFGQNIRDFGFDVAVELAEKSDYGDDEHDFGTCFIVDKSLRREVDGRWYVDLRVDGHKCRYVNVTSVLVDDDGNNVLDEHGKPQIRTAPRKEAWITVELSTIEPVRHPLAKVYRQRDRGTVAVIRMNERSEMIGDSKPREKKGAKGRRKRLSPEQLAGVMAKIGADSAS